MGYAGVDGCDWVRKQPICGLLVAAPYAECNGPADDGSYDGTCKPCIDVRLDNIIDVMGEAIHGKAAAELTHQ